MELKTIFVWIVIIVPILIGLWFQIKVIINFFKGNKKSLSNILLIYISAWSIAYVYVFISTISIGEWNESIESYWSFMVNMLICCYRQAVDGLLRPILVGVNVANELSNVILTNGKIDFLKMVKNNTDPIDHILRGNGTLSTLYNVSTYILALIVVLSGSKTLSEKMDKLFSSIFTKE